MKKMIIAHRDEEYRECLKDCIRGYLIREGLGREYEFILAANTDDALLKYQINKSADIMNSIDWAFMQEDLAGEINAWDAATTIYDDSFTSLGKLIRICMIVGEEKKICNLPEKFEEYGSDLKKRVQLMAKDPEIKELHKTLINFLEEERSRR